MRANHRASADPEPYCMGGFRFCSTQKNMIAPCIWLKIEAFYIFYEYNIGGILCFSDIYSQKHLISRRHVITGIGDAVLPVVCK